MKRLIVFGVVGAAIALLGAACSASSGTQTQGGGEGTALAIRLKELAIQPATIQVPAGEPVTLNISDVGAAQHSFAVDLGSRVLQTDMLNPGGTATLELPALDAGSYQAWCTVPGHREAGMQATLVAASGNGSGGASGNGEMGGMGMGGNGASGDQLGDGMTAEQMAAMHEKSMTAFPATTDGLGGQALPYVTDQQGVKRFQLTLTQTTWQVDPTHRVQALTYDGGVPGPEIRVHQGDRIRLEVTNRSPQPTTVHFHGLTVPNAQDGVPYITQDPIMPGDTFTSQFRVVDPPGTYMYHSHFNSAEQVGRGLYGAFVVEPRHHTWDEEYTEVLGDGPLGYTIDGKGWPATAPLTAKLGDWVLIRMMNAGQMLHPMHLHGYHFQVVAEDGATLDHPYSADTLVVAPGERFDVLVHATHPGVWAFHCHILSHVEGPQGMFGMATALIVK